MDIALETLLGQGVLGAFLVLVILHFRKEIKDYKLEIKEKEVEIKRLNEEGRTDAVQTISFMKDFKTELSNLVAAIKG